MRLGLTLLFVTVMALGVAGCSRDTKSSHLVEPDTSAVATMSIESTRDATGATDDGLSADDEGGTDSNSSPSAGDKESAGSDDASNNLSSQELDAIEAELEAIENELSSMALPEDADFDEIESALY